MHSGEPTGAARSIARTAIVALAVVLALSACTGSPPNPPPASSASTAPPTPTTSPSPTPTVDLTVLPVRPEAMSTPSADGAAAALVTSDGAGLALGEGISLVLENSHSLITWTIGNTGFAMELSGEVPGRLAEALGTPEVIRTVAGGRPLNAIDAWAVHPGGKSIVDAVERGLKLPPDKVAASRAVLQDYGNMSSATVLFVLERLMDDRPASGIALAFGPGLAMEGLRFGWTDGDAG